jgi:hypothetical protein
MLMLLGDDVDEAARCLSSIKRRVGAVPNRFLKKAG